MSSRGGVIAPLYPIVPIAAADDPMLHEYLALADTLRSGRARARDGAGGAIEETLAVSSQRASAAIATVGHVLAGQSRPVMFVEGGAMTAL